MAFRIRIDTEGGQTAVIRRLRVQAAVHRRGKPSRRRPPRWHLPDPVERKYARRIEAVVDAIQAAFEATITARLPALAREAQAEKGRGDAWPEATAQMLATFRLQLQGAARSRGQEVREIAAEVSTWNKDQWRRVMSATLGFDLVQAEPWLKNELTAWAEENAGLITTLQGQAIDDVEKWTLRGLRTGQRHEQIREQILERFQVSRSRAALIARDQVSKLNGNLTQARQAAIGVTEYIWRTTGDDRVRPTHRAKNGKRFKWSSPPADTGHPGDDYQCRCVAEPVLDKLIAALEGAA